MMPTLPDPDGVGMVELVLTERMRKAGILQANVMPDRSGQIHYMVRHGSALLPVSPAEREAVIAAISTLIDQQGERPPFLARFMHHRAKQWRCLVWHLPLKTTT